MLAKDDPWILTIDEDDEDDEDGDITFPYILLAKKTGPWKSFLLKRSLAHGLSKTKEARHRLSNHTFGLVS